MPVSIEDIPIENTAEFVPMKGTNRAKANAVNRTIKVAYPDCDECKEPKNSLWWKQCLARGHNPYVRFIEKESEEKTYKVRERDGAKILSGTKKVVKLLPRLNTTQIAEEVKSNAGKGLERAIQFRGVKPLSEMGYGNICEMAGCSVPAKFACQYGAFCSDAHARLIGYDRQFKIQEVYKQEKRKEQLARVNIIRVR